jgi:putative transposase
VLTLKQSKKGMKKSKFTESQIIKVLKSQEEGKKVSEICREFGISEPTFYNWKSKYG